MEYSAVFKKHGKMWMGYVEELPGANTQGATLDEARENFKGAIQFILEINPRAGAARGHRPRGPGTDRGLTALIGMNSSATGLSSMSTRLAKIHFTKRLEQMVE